MTLRRKLCMLIHLVNVINACMKSRQMYQELELQVGLWSLQFLVSNVVQHVIVISTSNFSPITLTIILICFINILLLRSHLHFQQACVYGHMFTLYGGGFGTV